jgi:hypothetical protein
MKLKVVFVSIAASTLIYGYALKAQATLDLSTPVTNHPFSAYVLSTTTVPRPDGTTLNMVHRTDIVRNSAGSVRSEDRILPNSPSKPIGSSSIDIHDVVKQLSIHIIPVTKVAIVNTLKQISTPINPTTGFPSGTVTVGPPQDLGVSNIAGYTATGSRQTLLTPAGSRGPNQIRITKDTWYSPDLETTLLVETKDDLGNSSKSALTQIVIGESDPALFAIPSTYATINADAPAMNTSTNRYITTPKLATQSNQTQAIPEKELFRSFFLYEAHLEHIADAHPEVPKGKRANDQLRRNIGLTESEWQQISASSMRIEAASLASKDQARSLIANNATICQSNPQSCLVSAPSLPKLRELRKQVDQTLDSESAALETSLDPNSAAKFKTYLHKVIASHIQVITIDPAVLNAAFQSSQEVSK